MNNADASAALLARRLVAARDGGPPVAWREMLPADEAGAYALQDATAAAMGTIGGWKVGAADALAVPHCAPLPASGVLATGAVLSGPQWRWRCVELEAALRVGRDVLPQGRLLDREALSAHFDAVLPAIEVVETRLADGKAADPLARLGDLQCHGALVLGEASPLAPRALDLRALQATLMFDNLTAAQTDGGNPAVDVWRLLAWLALHCEQRGLPLRRGQIVTTGSCTGLLAAPAGALVHGEIEGLGAVEMRFEA